MSRRAPVDQFRDAKKWADENEPFNESEFPYHDIVLEEMINEDYLDVTIAVGDRKFRV